MAGVCVDHVNVMMLQSRLKDINYGFPIKCCMPLRQAEKGGGARLWIVNE